LSETSFVSAMLAARQSLRRRNMRVQAWGRKQWDNWIATQQRVRPQPNSRKVLAVAAVSCLEDLPVHVGLLQLLGIAGIRCSVILSLPTPDMARLTKARARRDGWSGLVQILADDETKKYLESVDGELLLAVFPRPAVLPNNVLEALAAPVEAERNGHATSPLSIDPFVGLSRNSVGWHEGAEAVDVDTFALAVREILSLDTRILTTAPDVPVRSNFGLAEPPTLELSLERSERCATIAGLDAYDELLVAAWNSGDDAELIARIEAPQSALEGKIHIAMPSSRIATTSRAVQLQAVRSDGSATVANLNYHVPPASLKPWMVSAFLNRGGGGNPVIRAFAEGIGCRIAYAELEPLSLKDIPIVWGVLRDSDRIVAQAKAQDLYFFYIDHAYFNRGHGRSYRITRNRYEAGQIRKCPRDRAAALGAEVRPWRKSGRYIIVCPPTEYFMQAHDCEDWLEKTLTALRGLTDRPIRIREKPVPGEKSVPLAKALATAHALVTHSSNVAIEAACLGTPVFVAPASAAAPIGCTELDRIEEPTYPDREPWLAHLAYNQFSFEEIRSGEAWRMLLELEEREFV